MAVVKTPQASRLQIKVQTGVNGSGSPVYRVRALQNVKTNATDADIHSIAAGLAALQAHSVVSISRQDDATLIEE